VTVIDLDLVVAQLGELHGVSAFVEQTGGGVATIYAGPIRRQSAECTCPRSETLTEHDAECPVPAGGYARYAAIAGPGVYGWGQGPSTADLGDFYIGADDDGETDPLVVADVGVTREEDVARLIAFQAKKVDPTQPLTLAEAREALG